ncbi:MAG TPA: LysM peptidoglycan-binding domain-containing protein [Candidatus Binataceae bacterium]|nr:LysM peptidoglycan-binding domain-containing protein [Candidatus Binataceae bacterium]
MKFSLAFVTVLFVAALALSGLCVAVSSSYAQNSGYAHDDTPAAVNDSTSASQDSTQDTAPAPTRHGGEFSYSVRSGDSLGSIASTFGIQAADIAHANRLDLDATLLVGQTLRIPNPFATRMRELTAENQKLGDELADLRKRADSTTAAQTGLRAQVRQLTAGNSELTHEVRMLPWWRDAVYSAVIVSLLLLGVTALAVLEWFLLRRRFIAIADLNESLRRLDQRYRALLAKAELRMQELYGRRRRGISENQERPKLPEESDLERLDQQLRDVLERHLKQLGGPLRPRRRARWDEEFGTVASPVQARSARR